MTYTRYADKVSVADILRVVYLAGAAFVLGVMLLSNLRFTRRLKRTRVPYDTLVGGMRVYVAHGAPSPCLVGVLHPTVYLTPESTRDEQTLRHVLAHEATHRLHGDCLWSLLRLPALALHWYNPLVWYAAVVSRNDAELSCDEATIRRIGEDERAEYDRTLIGLTCQKRPALLLTATTMTGSGRSIKERIRLIAKKPKMAVYTLIAAVLIAAVAVGCTFTGANTDTPWAWAKELKVSDIVSVAILDSENELSDDEIEQLVSLMNALEKSDYTENKKLAGSTPTYGLIIETNSGMYHLNESISPDGNLEINYGEKQWWISNDELSAFVIKAAALESTENDNTTRGENEILLTGFSVQANGSYEEIGQQWAKAFVSQYVSSASRDNPRRSKDAAVFKCTPTAASLLSSPKRLIYLMSFVCDASDPAAFEQSFAGWAGPLSDAEYPQYAGWMNFGWFVELELTDTNTWTCVDAGTGGYGGWGYLNYDEIGEVDFHMGNMLDGNEGTPENLLRVLPFVDWATFDAGNWNKLYQFLDRYCLTEGQVYGPEATRMWSDVYPNDQAYRNLYVMLAALNSDGGYTEGFADILKKQQNYDSEIFETCLQDPTQAQRDSVRMLVEMYS